MTVRKVDFIEVDSIEERLAAAARGLPNQLAVAMYEALRGGRYRIAAGSYDSESALCPIAAADAQTEAWGKGRFPGWSEDKPFGGTVLRFAVCFDLCAQVRGLSAALGLVRTTLESRLRGSAET